MARADKSDFNNFSDPQLARLYNTAEKESNTAVMQSILQVIKDRSSAAGKVGAANVTSKARQAEAAAARLSAINTSVRTGMSLWSMLAPILVWAILVMVVIGPAGLVILEIFKTMNIYIWIGVIILAVFLWRRN